MKTKEEYQIEAVANLLASDQEYGDYEGSRQQIYTLIRDEFPRLLDKGTYPEKVKALQDIDFVLRDIEAFIAYPVMLGKNIVGIMGGTLEERLEFLREAVQLNETGITLCKNDSIPVIYSWGAEETIELYNKFNERRSIGERELKTIFRDLMLYRKMDLRQIITCLSKTTNQLYKDTLFIHFPKHVVRQSKEYSTLLHVTDIMICIGKEHKDLDYIKKHLREAKYKQGVYTHQIGDSYSPIKKHIATYNRGCNNIAIKEQAQNVLFRIQEFYKNEIEIQNTKLKQITQNLLLWDDEGKDALKQIKEDLNQSIQKNKSMGLEFEKFERQLSESIQERIEEAIAVYKAYSGEDIGQTKEWSLRKQEIVFETAYRLINLGKTKEAQELINQLTHNGYSKVCLLNIRNAHKKGLKVKGEDINKLNQLPQDEDVIRAQIELRDIIGLTEQEAVRLCMKYDYLVTADEFYLRAVALEKSDTQNSKKHYRYAIQRGHKRASERMWQLCQREGKVQERDMKFLANQLYPEANYQIACQLRANNKFMKSIFHLKLAGIYEHIKAIEELAAFYTKKDSEKAIPLYMFLSKKTQNYNKYAGNIGSAYYNLRDYNNAYNHLIKASDAESYYNLGKIYDFGLGRMKDLEEAKKCYKKAMDLGHKGAHTNYQKVSARSEFLVQRNRSNTSYNSSSNYSSYSSSSSNSSSDSWCFLTTATCKVLKKGDDCEELLAFKKYRDEWLIMQSDGASLIKEYYKIAPDIVAYIDQEQESDEIYQYMWDRYITVAYEYLKEKEYIRAKEIYIQMVVELMKKYKITR